MLSRQIASKLRDYETPFYLYDTALLRQTLESVVYESKKYGYKVQNAYEVFRVAKYDKMYYKNCRLPKKIVDGKFEDYPRALRDGISSYVAVGDGAVMIGVFNDNAYNNLVSQVRAAGFQLDMEGNEDIYTNGSYYIACNKNYRTVRITKVS